MWLLFHFDCRTEIDLLLLEWTRTKTTTRRRRLVVALVLLLAVADEWELAVAIEMTEQRLPVLPDTLKLPAAKLVDSRVGIEAPPSPQVPRVAATRPATRAMTGFAGVRLSVAFCSFVM